MAGSKTARRRNVVWKLPSVSADGLKWFACIIMLIQNFGIAIIENGMVHLNQYTAEELSAALEADSRLMMLTSIGYVLEFIGGLSVPVFAFLLVEGFLHTSDFRKYLLRMAAFALISEIPYDLAIRGSFIDLSSQNPLFTMTIGLLMLYFLRMLREKYKGISSALLQIILVICAYFWANLLRANYGFGVLLLIAIFYCFYSRNVLKTLFGVIVSFLYITGPLAFYGIWCYTEERTDRLPKYAYYIFYPAHLLVLGVAALLL